MNKPAKQVSVSVFSQKQRPFVSNPVKENKSWASIVSGCTVPMETNAREQVLEQVSASSSYVPPTPPPSFSPPNVTMVMPSKEVALFPLTPAPSYPPFLHQPVVVPPPSPTLHQPVVVPPPSPISSYDRNDDTDSQISDESLDYHSDVSDDDDDLSEYNPKQEQVYSYTPTLERFPEYQPHNVMTDKSEDYVFAWNESTKDFCEPQKRTIQLETLIAPPTLTPTPIQNHMQPFLMSCTAVQYICDLQGVIIGMIVEQPRVMTPNEMSSVNAH